MTLSYNRIIHEKPGTILTNNCNDDIVVSYHNTCVRKADLNLLLTSSSDKWLNDVIIGFAFEYFEYDLYKKYADNIAFLDPSLAHILKLSQDKDIEFLLAPLNLRSKDLILIPINDHASYHDSGGTHWSLAVFYKIKPENEDFEKPYIQVYHYDSNHLAQGISNNYNHALKLAQNLVPYLIKPDQPLKNHLAVADKKNGLSSFSPGQIAKNIKNGIIRSSPRLNKSFISFTHAGHNDISHNAKENSEVLTNTNNKFICHPNFCIKEVSQCPQQKNGYDCGVYCIAFAEIIASSYVSYLKKLAKNNINQPKNIIITRNRAKNSSSLGDLNGPGSKISSLSENDEFNEDLSHYLDKECLSSTDTSNSSSPDTTNIQTKNKLSSNINKMMVTNGKTHQLNDNSNNSPASHLKETSNAIYVLPYTTLNDINIDNEIEPKLNLGNCLDSNTTIIQQPIDTSNDINVNGATPSYTNLITPEYISNKRKELYNILLKLNARENV